MYSTFLLDLDHTLIDSDVSLTVALEDTLRTAGVADPHIHYETFDTINRALWRKVEALELTPGEVSGLRFEKLRTVLDIDASAESMTASFRHGLGQHGDLYDGVREVLDALHGRVRMALVTNGLTDVQMARVERLELGHYFDALVISDAVGTAKPSADIFDITFDRLGVTDRATTVMVGDSLASDIRGGNNAGIATCWYNPNAAPLDHHHATPQVTHEIRQLDELLTLVA